MRTKYYKRTITFDEKTNMYCVSIPELGIEVHNDTEVSAIVEARQEVENYARSRSKVAAYTGELD